MAAEGPQPMGAKASGIRRPDINIVITRNNVDCWIVTNMD